MRALEAARAAEERRMDARFGLVCAVLANCHRDPKARRQPYTVEDFMPRERPRTQADLVARIRMMCGSLRSNT